MRKIEIDGEVLYVEEMGNFSEGGVEKNSFKDVFKTTSDGIKKALHPIVTIGKTLKSSVVDLQPDEIELAFELQMGTDENNPVFAVVGTTAEAHMTVKFVWKKEEKKTTK